MEDQKGKIFDPQKHDAVYTENDKKKAKDIILKVLSHGYYKNEKIIKFPKVVVNRSRSTKHLPSSPQGSSALVGLLAKGVPRWPTNTIRTRPWRETRSRRQMRATGALLPSAASLGSSASSSTCRYDCQVCARATVPERLCQSDCARALCTCSALGVLCHLRMPAGAFSARPACMLLLTQGSLTLCCAHVLPCLWSVAQSSSWRTSWAIGGTKQEAIRSPSAVIRTGWAT